MVRLHEEREDKEEELQRDVNAYLFCSKKELLLSKRRSVVINILKLDNNCCISKRKKSFAISHVAFLGLEIQAQSKVSNLAIS